MTGEDTTGQDTRPPSASTPPATRLAGRSASSWASRWATVWGIITQRHVLRVLGTVVSLGILALSVLVLARTLTALSWSDLRRAVVATGPDQLILAFVATACSYLALTGYDALALRQLRLAVPYRTTALASFTSYAVSFTLGFPIITAGTVRYWIYSQANVSAGKVASLTVIAGVTFWLGMALMLGLALAFQPTALSQIDHLSVFINLGMGLAILAAIAVYLVWVSRGHRKTHFQGLHLELPGLSLTLGQLVLGVVDLCSAAGVLYLLLPPDTEIGFFIFVAIYVFACLLGIASNAPGGLGTFEATMLNVVPAHSQGALFASLLMFRVIYYLVPFLLALALLGAHEALRRWTSLRHDMETVQEAEPAGDEPHTPGKINNDP